MSLGLIVSFTGVIVAGLAGVLGVWMERGPDSSAGWAVFFSGLIGLSMGVELVHTGWQNIQDAQTDGKMATLLLQLSELSEHNPELQEFVSAELAVQQRTNPQMVKRLEKKVEAKGGDPNAIRQMADEGRQRARRPAPPPKTKDAAKAAPPEKKKKDDEQDAKAEAKADAQAAAAAEEAAAKLAAANKQAAKALAEADAKAKALVADANKQAEMAAQKAAEAQKLAEEKMKQATEKLAEAEKLMGKAEAALKSVPDVPGLPGGGKGGKGGKSKVPKIPGL